MIGQIMITQNCHPVRMGIEVEVLSNFTMQRSIDEGMKMYCCVRTPDNETFLAMRCQLRKPDDHQKPAKWEDCVWSPKGVTI